MKATHNVKAYRNNMDTSGGTVYFGRYITNENVPLTALCEQIAMYSGLTAIQARAILEGSFDAIAALEGEGLVIVHLDGMSVSAVITGSFPTGDAAFDPERNKLVLAIRLDDSVRLSLAGETAQMVTDSDLTRVRLDNVKDVAVERPVNLIHGQHVFRAAGWNIVLDDEGARVYMTDRRGVEHAVVVDEVHSKQLFTAHTAELLDGGDYTLWVESRGGDAEGPLQRDKCRVKYLRVEDPPTPLAQTSDGQVKVMSVTDGGQSETFTFGDEWAAAGEGFTGSAAQWFAELASVRTMPEADAVMASCQAIDANTLKIECDAGDAPAAGDYPDATLEIGMAHYESGELVTETLTIPIHLVVE